MHLKVEGISLSDGSLIFEFAVLFRDENSAVSVQNIQNVLQATNTLTDGNNILNVDTQYVTESSKFRSL